MSLTGILSVDLLNKSFAHKSAFCGFPLKLSAFDGVFNATTLTALRHDWQHASFAFCFSNSSGGFKKIYEAYAEVYEVISVNQESVSRNLDQVCLFFMGHEDSMFPIDWYVSKGIFNFKNVCNALKIELQNLVKKPQESFVEKRHLSSDTPSDICRLSLVELAKAQSQMEGAIDWGNFDWSQFTSQPEKVTYEVQNSFNVFRYNILFDIKEMLAGSGIDFQVWKDGQYNADEMLQVLTTVVDEFKDRYAAHLDSL